MMEMTGPDPERNVLLLVVDCLRADFVYERDRAHTPIIDGLMDGGFSFHNTITSTTTTTPSFASLMTGLYPHENGVRSHTGYTMKKGVRTYPEVLSENGYHTYAEMTGPLGREVGLTRGFDRYAHRDRDEIIHSDWGEELLERMEHDFQEPWFLLFHIWSLHEPRTVIEEREDKRFGKTLYGRALSSIDRYLGRFLKTLPEGTLVVLTGDHGEQIATSGLDLYIKRKREMIYEKLRERGLSRAHYAKAVRNFHIGHGYSIYDVLVRVPLVFHCDGLVPAGTSGLQVRQMDLMPTITDLLSIEGPEVTARSLVPVMEGTDRDHREVFLEAVGVNIPTKEEWLAGIRLDNRWKYIYSPFIEEYEEELYDLEEDPEERRNLARKRPEVVKLCREKIEAMRTERMVGEEMGEEDKKRMEERLRALGYLD